MRNAKLNTVFENTMTTLSVMNENIQTKIKIESTMFHDMQHFVQTTIEKNADMVQTEMFREWTRIVDSRVNVNTVIDAYQLGAQLYLIEYWKHDDDVVQKWINIYRDSDFYISENQMLDLDDLTELKDIYYNGYYTYTKFKYRIRDKASKVTMRKNDIKDQFMQLCAYTNIDDTLDNFVKYLGDFAMVYATVIGMDTCAVIKVQQRLSKYKTVVTERQIKEELYDVCNCGNRMIVQSATSEMVCVRCGKITLLLGSVTEESQLFAQEGNRVAHGSYDPTRHCKFWIERIQAKESTVIPDEYIERIRKSIQRDKHPNPRSLSVQQLRSYLKQNGLSRLNDHIPLIKKIITGYIPPQLTHREQQMLFIYFDKATKTYDIIKPSNKKNSLYYPFLIYKILDMVIADEDKKRGLLSCIHLQSYDTLIDNDRIWYDICARNECFDYRPTNKMDFV